MALESFSCIILVGWVGLFCLDGVVVGGVETLDNELGTRLKPLGCFGGTMVCFFD